MRDDCDEVPSRRLRHAVELEADVEYPDGHSGKAKLSNVSLDGCRLTGWFRVGDRLFLTIPKIGRLQGEVRWAAGGYAGIRFIASNEADAPRA